MFLGHFGIGFGAKVLAPRASLGTTFLAAQFVDLLWPTLLQLGVEQVRIAPGITAVTPLDFISYPISHRLLLSGVWSLIFGLGYLAVTRHARAATILGLVVLSHWFLDALVHRPDLPLYPGGVRVGLGLWSSWSSTFLVELPIFLLGVFGYARSTQPRTRAGSLGFALLVAFLAIVYAGNLYGPPPPSVTALAGVGEAQWLLIAWAYWIDRHRAPRASDARRIVAGLS